MLFAEPQGDITMVNHDEELTELVEDLIRANREDD